MTYAMRVLRDILWIVVFFAVSVLIYRAVTGAPLATGASNAVIVIAALAAGLLAILPFVAKFKPGDPKRVTAFDMTTITSQFAMRDSAARVTLLAVMAVPLAGGLLHAGVLDGKPSPSPVDVPRARDAMRTELVLDGNRNGDEVVFDHRGHQERTGGQDGCVKCHHYSAPGDKTSSCYGCHADMKSETNIFNHEYHQKRLGNVDSCPQCHGDYQEKSAAAAKGCVECHAEDMGLKKGEKLNPMAPSYPNAMHAGCVGCHRENADKTDKKNLSACDTCHQAVGHEAQELDLQ